MNTSEGCLFMENHSRQSMIVLVSVSMHARTHAPGPSLKGFDISKGMVKLFGPTPPLNPIPFAWNLGDSSLPLIYHPVVQIAPLERNLSVYAVFTD